MAYCSNCGAQIADNTQFCPECGSSNALGTTNSAQRQQEYAGKILKCPNCGETLKPFNANCPACGYELRSAKSTDSVRELTLRLEQIEATRVVEKPRSIYKAANSETIVSKTDEQKATLISMFPIPNTKEDLFEFIILAKSNVDCDSYKDETRDSARVISDAWKAKFEQAYEKAEVSFGNDPEFQHIQTFHQELTTNIKKAKSSNWKVLGIAFLVLAAVVTLITVAVNKSSSNDRAREVARLESIVVEVEDCLERSEYKLALMNAESIKTDSYDEEIKRQFDIKREYLIDKVIEEAAENGVILNRTPQDDLENYSVSEEERINEDGMTSDSGESEENTSNSIDYSDITIEKGANYSYMSDEWNLYVATAISENIVEIENWEKTFSSSKTVDYEYDVGTYKINDSVNSFLWLDDEHTAFAFTLQDKNNSRVETPASVVFTININDDAKNKGTNYSSEIICYSFQNDDWHFYRAIPLTETMMKIECWYRGFALGDFLYGYDMGVIDLSDTDTDFEWTDDGHTAFTITMQDSANSDLKKPTFVAFTIENEKYTFTNVKSYVNSQK